jgi:hypothetical protein
MTCRRSRHTVVLCRWPLRDGGCSWNLLLRLFEASDDGALRAVAIRERQAELMNQVVFLGDRHLQPHHHALRKPSESIHVVAPPGTLTGGDEFAEELVGIRKDVVVWNSEVENPVARLFLDADDLSRLQELQHVAHRIGQGKYTNVEPNV